ncbi:propionyl-CoA carboxylase alpha chain [Antricoccus suffuscus]|uniref:Propionyl-CoA carboxylase alpha chain n=1 Tax=Antricoccus suffuscus TaxID=1629062 RepID=A0A2T0ZWJ2_9ACTN|nr:biotin carboxylase N-terminal domain-containing protein [Antricoccus suffuscus]PRZ40716.1 propionyl-CoA carboxylase alpha chain [Antricoccus suffuscus]
MTTPQRIERILVANRGEIARRVFATCRTMGISTVAVFSDADEDAPFVAEADLSVHLPGATPSETYLRTDLILAAAKSTGATAIHPGYGFLSENAAFAQAVSDAGLVWIGPPPESIKVMGSKIESKRMMADSGVPILDKLNPADVTDDDLPVLVKASAGGGGRGMRIVETLDRLKDQIASAQQEAGSAFGDDTVFCERYIPTGHHIEVQLMADQHGTIWAVGERECSIQRRYQKVVEEAPSPLVERISGMREELFEAARAAAKTISYVGAGTVEFLADDDGHFYFLEMNTRLQVEHPVTECTSGLDLVRLQIEVAQGERLEGEPSPSRGSSIEVRLYAEDPAHDYQPQAGVMRAFEVPAVQREFGVLDRAGVRLDSGVVAGSVIGTDYDPMLAKVISWAPTRTESAAILADALRRAKLHGVTTNRDSLVRILTHPAFVAGDTDTSFLTKYADQVLALVYDERDATLAGFAAALAYRAGLHGRSPVNGTLPQGWRNVLGEPIADIFTVSGQEVAIRYMPERSGPVLEGRDDVRVLAYDAERVLAEVAGVRQTLEVTRYDSLFYVSGPRGTTTLQRHPRFVDPADQVAEGSLIAPMPGSVLRIACAVGDPVVSGQPLMWLEAMKMEHQIVAPYDGVITEILVEVSTQVDVGTALAVVEKTAEDAGAAS